MTVGLPENPRIAFLGTGAQGASIAADFVMAGLDVTFIDQWPAHVEVERAHRRDRPRHRGRAAGTRSRQRGPMIAASRDAVPA